LHAAIIAINATLEEGDAEETLSALGNPAACLNGVDEENMERYHLVLKAHKRQKVETSLDRSLSDSYVADAYDELLSQYEIQGHVNKVNLLAALEDLASAAATGDTDNVLAKLRAPCLALGVQVQGDRGESYAVELQQALEGADEGFLKLREVERIVKQVNQVRLKLHLALKRLSS